VTTLAELAAEYEHQARRAAGYEKRDRLQRDARLLRSMVANRYAMDPAQLRLHMDMPLDLPVRWCRQHGYRTSLGYGGLTLQRDDEPALVASSGDVLHWDGTRITVTTP
jgi:hypothetical protein